jgi:cyanophycinase
MQSSGDHQVDDEPDAIVEAYCHPLTDARKTVNGPPFSGGQWRFGGAQQEYTTQPHFDELLADDTGLEGTDVRANVWQLGHGASGRQTHASFWHRACCASTAFVMPSSQMLILPKPSLFEDNDRGCRKSALQEVLPIMPSKIPEGESRGWIVPIGGAENKENDRHILERFVRISGGRAADIVVIPTASRMHETGPRYEQLFKEIGAAQVAVMDFDTRRDCQEAGRLRRLEQASGIFFTGGNQLRLSTLLGGTPVAKLIRVRNAHGVTVGGTSAGASILSEHMIAFGDEGSAVISGSVRLAPGLGLTNRFIIDQHFRQRDRLGRLITALAYNPFAVGIGLDEDTAAFIGPDETVEVHGSGGVTVVDAADMSYSSISEVGEGQPVCVLGLRVHILVEGATFNLHTRLASAAGLVSPKQ